MKGLLLKDFYGLKRYGKILIFLLFSYIAIRLISDSNVLITIIGTVNSFVLFIFVINNFSSDASAHWNQFSINLPLSKRRIVFSKYILSFFLTAFGFLLSVLIGVVMSISTKNLIMHDILLINYVIFAFALLVLSLLLPLIAKFGVEKARIMIVLITVISSQIIFRFMDYLNVPMLSGTFINHVLSFSPFILVGLMGISYFITCKILENKEF